VCPASHIHETDDIPPKEQTENTTGESNNITEEQALMMDSNNMQVS